MSTLLMATFNNNIKNSVKLIIYQPLTLLRKAEKNIQHLNIYCCFIAAILHIELPQ